MHFQKKEANKECTCDERDANGRCERGEADKKDKQTWKEHIFLEKKILPNLFFSLLFALVFSQSKCASVYYITITLKMSRNLNRIMASLHGVFSNVARSSFVRHGG